MEPKLGKKSYTVVEGKHSRWGGRPKGNGKRKKVEKRTKFNPSCWRTQEGGGLNPCDSIRGVDVAKNSRQKKKNPNNTPDSSKMKKGLQRGKKEEHDTKRTPGGTKDQLRKSRKGVKKRSGAKKEDKEGEKSGILFHGGGAYVFGS